MLLFLAIALSAIWICSCILGLALGAMLARTDGRTPARLSRRRRVDADGASAPERRAAGERVLPTA
ncbi:MAG: hypothetical protein QOJ63_2462 [Solirubrobacteraceae bacterium]|jgi:hypothetical protein|nr:hypothetical protein [Solirubrobacteraceae bacterium]